MAPKNIYRPGRTISQGGGSLSKKQKEFKKRYTPPKKDKPKKSSASNKQSNKILQELDEAQKKKDRQESTTTTGTTLPGSSTKNTKEFIDDLKEAYKFGLFTGGTKTKALMNKYNLTGDDILRLRSGIDTGLGTVVSSYSNPERIGSNALLDVIGDLRQEGILTQAAPSKQFLQQRAANLYDEGMTKYDREPVTGLLGMAPFVNLGLSGLDFIAGGSDKGAPASFYARNALGLEGEELDNFAAAVANDETLYKQMMSTPEMQDYQLNQFRTEVNKNAMAKMKKDIDPISGTQSSVVRAEEDDMITSPSTDSGSGAFPYSPALQNYFTFFDPTIGKYRSGTYDEYLQYVTAKDGGIIQLQQGGTDEDPIANAPGGRSLTVNDVDPKSYIADLFSAREKMMNLVPSTDPKTGLPRQSEVEGKDMMLKFINEKIDLLLSNPAKERRELIEDLDSSVKMAEEDQPARDLFGDAKESLDGIFQNLKGRRDLAEDPVTTASMIVLDNRDGKLKVVPRNRETLEMLQNGTYSQTTRDAVESGVMVSPSPIGRFSGSNELQGKFNGGVIGLKEGGMNDMMQADSLMFKDPSDEGQWEYNV